MAEEPISLGTSNWIQFFLHAGLPANTAANYAVIFTDHRIKPDMLLDLSKEYLFDMGITLLGDVISILKYAKVAHIQSSRERMLAGTLNKRALQNQTVDDEDLEPKRHKRIAVAPATSTETKPLSARRLIGHYTKALSALPSKQIMRLVPQVIQSQDKPVRKNIISLKQKIEETPKLQKVRRVLPEHEGRYKIKMPTGTTIKTRKILQQQGIKLVKKSVFDRLGDSSVSSSTDVLTKTNTSVFQRLGPTVLQKNNSSTVSSTSFTNQSAESESVAMDPPLPYRGVLKTTIKHRPSETKMSNLRVTKVVRPVNSPQVSTTSLFIKSLNEATSPQKRSASHGLFGTARLAKTNVKHRLGLSAASTGSLAKDNLEGPVINVRLPPRPTRTQTVFQRLGPVNADL